MNVAFFAPLMCQRLVVSDKISVFGRKSRPLLHYYMESGFVLACEERMSQPDEQCVRACLDGQPAVFRHLVERHQLPLARYLCARLGNAEEATEAAQETFVRAYFALPKLQKPASFFSWLLGIADRVAKETRRAAARRRTVDWGQLDPAEPADKHDSCTDTGVAEAVAKLPDMYREVIMRRFYAGQSCAEIAGDLDVPLGTVTKRLSRAYTLLRQHLGPNVPNRENEVSR
jgi:RNA polymerase sigma-70 factor (ECF subfamily)